MRINQNEWQNDRQNDRPIRKGGAAYPQLILMAAVVAAMTALPPPRCNAYDLYVASVKAQVYLMPDTGSEKLFELKQGTRISGLKKAEYWHQVSHQGRSGWIYSFQVAVKPPVKKRDIYGAFTSLLNKYKLFSDRSRRRSSAYSSVAAARGLRENRLRIHSGHRLDYEALEKMESVDITESQALMFLQEGTAHETHR
ncbi:MAG: hypothetical protein ACOZF0_22625 [Thermodesulfobacteriota bacterium]